MNNKNTLAEMEKLFMALSDKTRLRLLNLMRDGEVCVCYFTEVLGESQPKISRHLAYLRNAEIVSARREGKWIHYRIEFPEDDFAAKILQNTLEWLESQRDMQADYLKLSDVYHTTDTPVTISRNRASDIFAESNMKPVQKEELDTFLL